MFTYMIRTPFGMPIECKEWFSCRRGIQVIRVRFQPNAELVVLTNMVTSNTNWANVRIKYARQSPVEGQFLLNPVGETHLPASRVRARRAGLGGGS